MGTEKIRNRDDWKFVTTNREILLKDKERLIYSHLMYMFNKTQRIFKYNNLPEELPQRQIELFTQCYGFTIWKKVDGKMYVFYGGLGGIPNAYYLPTLAIVTNPFLKYNKMLEIDKDCVVMWNDSMHYGLMPINEKYASLIAENEISLRVATINARIPAIIEVNNDTEKATAEEYLQKVEDGELAVFSSDRFIDEVVGQNNRIKDFNNRATSHIKELIEENQYLHAKWWNEIGINANFNMKRESINESEASMNEDGLLPLIDDMLECRKIAVEQINQMFGLNISVELSSSWKKIRVDIETAQKVEQAKEETPDVTPKKEETEDE